MSTISVINIKSDYHFYHKVLPNMLKAISFNIWLESKFREGTNKSNALSRPETAAESRTHAALSVA